jgi:hypothetical protein
MIHQTIGRIIPAQPHQSQDSWMLPMEFYRYVPGIIGAGKIIQANFKVVIGLIHNTVKTLFQVPSVIIIVQNHRNHGLF